MDMEYDNDDRLGIPNFMQKTSTYRNFSVYGKRQSSAISDDKSINMARRNSLDSRRIQATRCKKAVDNSLSGVLKKHWRGLVVTMGIGAVTLSGVQTLSNMYYNVDMVSKNPVVAATSAVVDQHKSITSDFRNWQLDAAAVADDINTILKNGADSLIVLGTLGNSLNEPYTQDELSTIVKSSFGEDPDILVRSLNPERYDQGIQDPDFKEDVRNYIVKQTEADIARASIDANSELKAMFSETSTNVNSDMKGMGGK